MPKINIPGAEGSDGVIHTHTANVNEEGDGKTNFTNIGQPHSHPVKKGRAVAIQTHASAHNH